MFANVMQDEYTAYLIQKRDEAERPEAITTGTHGSAFAAALALSAAEACEVVVSQTSAITFFVMPRSEYESRHGAILGIVIDASQI